MGACEICGQTGEVVHEIIERGVIRDEAIWSIPENQMLLCYRCHNSIHKGKKSMADRLEKACNKIRNAKSFTSALERKKNGRD